MANGQGPGQEQFKILMGNPDEMNSLQRIRRARDLAAQKVDNQYRADLEKQEARLNQTAAKNAEAAKKKAAAQQGGKILAGEIEGATGQATPVNLQPGPGGPGGPGFPEGSPEERELTASGMPSMVSDPTDTEEQMLANMTDLGIDPKDSKQVDLFQRAHRENMAQRQPFRTGTTGVPQIDRLYGVANIFGLGPGATRIDYMPPQNVTHSQMKDIAHKDFLREEAGKQAKEAGLEREHSANVRDWQEDAEIEARKIRDENVLKRRHTAQKRIWAKEEHEQSIERGKQARHLTDLQIKDEEGYNAGAKGMVDSLSPTGGDGQKIPDRISSLRAESILRSEGGRSGELNRLNAARSNITNAVPAGTPWKDVETHASNRFMQAFIKDNATAMSAVSNGEIFMFSGDFGPDIIGQSKEGIFSDESQRPYRSREMSVIPLQPRFNQIIHSSSEVGAKNFALGEFFGDIVGSHYIKRYGLTKEWRELSGNFIDKNGEFNTKAFGKFKNAMIKQGQHGNAKSLNLLFGQLNARTKDASEEQRNIDLRPSRPEQAEVPVEKSSGPGLLEKTHSPIVTKEGVETFVNLLNDSIFTPRSHSPIVPRKLGKWDQPTPDPRAEQYKRIQEDFKRRRGQ